MGIKKVYRFTSHVRVHDPCHQVETCQVWPGVSTVTALPVTALEYTPITLKQTAVKNSGSSVETSFFVIESLLE